MRRRCRSSVAGPGCRGIGRTLSLSLEAVAQSRPRNRARQRRRCISEPLSAPTAVYMVGRRPTTFGVQDQGRRMASARPAGVYATASLGKRQRCSLSRPEDLDVDQACGVIDADVHELPAGAAGSSGLAGITSHAMPDLVDAPELLHIDVKKLAGPFAFVATHWLRGLKSRELALPDPGQDARHRRCWHTQRERDVLAGQAQFAQRDDRADALIRVRCGTERGAEERSTSPASPSARYRPTHFQQVRSLTPAASAAAMSDQLHPRRDEPSSASPSGRAQRYRAVSSGVLLGTEGLRHHSASKEARTNNALRNYT